MAQSVAGAADINQAVVRFYERMLDDPELAPWFVGIDMRRLRAHQHAFLMLALGGPELYTGRSMGEAHAGLHIPPGAFDRAVDHLVASMREAHVSEDVVARARCRVEDVRRLIVENGSRDVDDHPG